MSEETLVKDIVNGVYTSGQLTTALTDLNNKWDFIRALNMPFYSRILFDDTTALSLLFASTGAKALLLASSKALDVMASSEVATKTIFSDKALAKDILTNQYGFNAYRNNNDNYKRLKRQVNASGSKLKQNVYTSAGANSLSVTGLTVYSTAMLGGGSYVFSSGTGYSGAGAELLAKMEVINLTTTITLTVGAAGYSGSLSGVDSTISASGLTTVTANGGDATGGGGGGTTTNNGYLSMSDTNLLAPWQFASITNKGGNPLIESGVDIRAGGLGGGFYTEYGKGAALNNEIADNSTGGIIVFNYIAD
jgi:hypothetical protein